MEYVVRVDGRGRVVIPREVRRLLGIGRVVRLRVERGKVVIEPVRDPLVEVSELVVRVSFRASREPGKVGRLAFERLMEEFEG